MFRAYGLAVAGHYHAGWCRVRASQGVQRLARPVQAGAIPALYPDCTPDVAAWAAGRLRRQSLAPHREPCPLDRLPGGRSPFLARPAALADLLEKLTADSPVPAT